MYETLKISLPKNGSNTYWSIISRIDFVLIKTVGIYMCMSVQGWWWIIIMCVINICILCFTVENVLGFTEKCTWYSKVFYQYITILFRISKISIQ